MGFTPRLCHAPLKRLIQTRPHMSTSRCGNICIMQPKCSREDRRRGFSNRSSVDAVMSGRSCVFLCESKSTLFGLPKVDAFSESDVTYGQVWWPILGISALYLTHPKCTHSSEHTQHEHTPGAVGSHLCCATRGAVVGSVPCSRAPQSWYWGWRECCTFTPPHLQFLLARDSNSQPLDYESDSLTIRPRLPLKEGIIKITYNRTATHFMDDRFVNLGEEVILTLLWQSGASESATVCFVISLSICYWLFKCRVLRIVCVCTYVWERARERGSQRSVVCVC